MTDNELFNHFKTKSIRCNEMPSNDLWVKIENSLNNNKPAFKPHMFFAIALGLIMITAITFYMLFSTDKTIKSPVTPIVIKQSVVSPIQPSAITEVSSISISKEERTITKVNPEIISIPTTSPEKTITDSVKKVQIRTAKVTEITLTHTAQPAINFHKTNDTLTKTQLTTYEVIKKETPGNIIITTKEKITKDEYKQLILDMADEYKNHSETLLTIKAPGHKLFKKVVGNDKKLTAGYSTDSIKLNVTTPALQTENSKLNSTTEKLEIPSFKTVKLKKESLPKIREKISN